MHSFLGGSSMLPRPPSLPSSHAASNAKMIGAALILNHYSASVLLGLQPSFGIDRGHATGARRGDRLPIHAVLHVSASEHSRHRRSRRPFLHAHVSRLFEF